MSTEQAPSTMLFTEQVPLTSQGNGRKEVHLLACYLRGTRTTAAATLCQVNSQESLLSRLPAPGNKKRGKAENYKVGRKIKVKVNNSHMRLSTYIHMRRFELRNQVGQRGSICPAHPEA